MVCVLIYNRMREKLNYTPEFNKLSIKEQALLDKLTDAIWKFVRKTPKLNQVPSKTRDAHATTYAILQGKFLVDKAFEQHLLFPVNILNATLRISNAHMKIVKGNAFPAYGFSLKLMHDGQTTANFPFVNFPVFPFNNVSNFLKLFTALNTYFSEGFLQKCWSAIGIMSRILTIVPNIFQRDFLKNIIKLLKKRNDSVFSFTYHSIGAYRFGDHIVKLKLIPEQLTSQTSVEDLFAQKGQYIANLYIQYAYNLKDQPVNILHKEWKNSPFIRIGKFIFTDYVDKNDPNLEQMSFNPFESSEVFQPVGRIQQLRNKAYEASLRERTH